MFEISNTKKYDLKDNTEKLKKRIAEDVIFNSKLLYGSKEKKLGETLKSLKKEINDTGNSLKKQQDEIQMLMSEQKRKIKIKTLLEKTKQLISSGLVERNSNLKKEIKIILKVVEELPEEKLDYHILDMMKVLNRSFGSE